MMSDTETVAALWERARAHDLRGVNLCCVYSLEQMAAAYNGCGPEWMPAKVRKVLDLIYADFAPCFLIHDVEWANCDGTESAFHDSNEALRDNCLKLADELHPWWSLLRYRRRKQARLIYWACETFGRGAYNAAYIEATTKPKQPQNRKDKQNEIV